MNAKYKWGLFVFIVILPFVVSGTTATVSFGRASDVEFCASCHVMTPYVEDMRDPQSDKLAAKHFQHKWISSKQCYTCHTNYDFLGPVDAKIRGLRHAAAYYLSPRKDKIKLYKPFPNASCLHCHEDAKTFKESETHGSMMESIKSGEMSCVECHGPVHPSGEGKS